MFFQRSLGQGNPRGRQDLSKTAPRAPKTAARGTKGLPCDFLRTRGKAPEGRRGKGGQRPVHLCVHSHQERGLLTYCLQLFHTRDAHAMASHSRSEEMAAGTRVSLWRTLAGLRWICRNMFPRRNWKTQICFAPSTDQGRVRPLRQVHRTTSMRQRRKTKRASVGRGAPPGAGEGEGGRQDG